MLTISSDIVRSIRAAKQAPDLYEYLQAAIELEHSTIPPYLQAIYSIMPGKNTIVADLIRSVAVEEMLHMAIAANVLNAIGGQPVINKPGFIPVYPGPLPMSVGDGLKVGLAPLSMSLLENTFMKIEAPEDPKHFPVKMMTLETTGVATIGLFYAAIIEKLKELGDGVFTGDRSRQVVDNTWFPADQLFEIRDVASAVRGLDLIVSQGEGSSQDPLEADGQPAHYYRFEEIVKGRRLMPDLTVPEKYSYSGAPIPFDQTGVWDMVTDPKLQNYPKDSKARTVAERFNVVYTNLLNGLHVTFDGQPKRLATTIGGMYELRLTAEALIAIRDSGSGKLAAPTFEYAPDSA